MTMLTRKQCRAGDECRPREFVEAADCLGHHSAIPLPVIAKVVNRSYGYLSKALSLYAESNPLRGDLIVPLTLASGDNPSTRNYALLDWMEAQVGRVAVQLPSETVSGGAEAFTLARDVMRETAAAIEHYGAAKADGLVDHEESAAVSKQIDRAIAALTRVKFAAAAEAKTAPIAHGVLSIERAQGGRT